MKKCDQFKERILTDYVDGHLDDNSVARLENHLLDCPDCGVFLKEIKKHAVLPFEKVPIQPVPAQLWENISQSIGQKQSNPLEDLISQLKGWIVWPKMLPVFASLLLVLLVAPISLNMLQIHQIQDMEQGEYLISALGTTASSEAGENNDLATPIESYFL